MRLNTLYSKLIYLLGSNHSKLRQARKEGVTVGVGCTLLGRVDWGSEPYLITIGNNVKITSNCKFVTHDGGIHVLRNIDTSLRNADLMGQIKIGNNVFIGINSIIMPGVTIGNNVVIGAGSIVTRDIKDDSIACGVPARLVSTLDRYRAKALQNSLATKAMTDEEKKAFLLNYFNGNIEVKD